MALLSGKAIKHYGYLKRKNTPMKLQMAPMEGITTYIYRNAHAAHFGQMDKYYTPFLSLHKEKEFSHKEKQEILPEHNKNLHVVPQVLTNSSAEFLQAVPKIKDIGYDEININIGCPSGTVVSKKKGAGMLADPEALERFLEEIFAKSPIDISIKTRLGMESVDEWPRLLEIYNRYPIKELIVHARVRRDFYKNTPSKEAYIYAKENSKNPLCYNGDIFTAQDYCQLQKEVTEENVMLGRGLISNPFLAEDLYKLGQAETGKTELSLTMERCKRLQDFHDEIYEEYRKILSGDQPVLFKMKELWTYMIGMWPDAKKQSKAIYKSKKCTEYEAVVKELFSK